MKVKKLRPWDLNKRLPLPGHICWVGFTDLVLSHCRHYSRDWLKNDPVVTIELNDFPEADVYALMLAGRSYGFGVTYQPGAAMIVGRYWIVKSFANYVKRNRDEKYFHFPTHAQRCWVEWVMFITGEGWTSDRVPRLYSDNWSLAVPVDLIYDLMLQAAPGAISHYLGEDRLVPAKDGVLVGGVIWTWESYINEFIYQQMKPHLPPQWGVQEGLGR